MNLNTPGSSSNESIPPYAEVTKYLNLAEKNTVNAKIHATSTAKLVIESLKQMSEKLNAAPFSEGKEKKLNEIKLKTQNLEEINLLLQKSKKNLCSLDLIEKIYQGVKEVKDSLVIESDDTVQDLEIQWNNFKKDHSQLKKNFTKAKMHYWDFTQSILANLPSDKNSMEILKQIPKEKIRDFTSLKKALKINSLYKPSNSKKPVKVLQEGQKNLSQLAVKPPKGVLSPDKLPTPDDGLFLHLHGDFFGEGSGLEGNDIETILNYGLAFINAKKETFEALATEDDNKTLTSKFDNIQSQLTTAIEIVKLLKSVDNYNLDKTVKQLRALMQKSLESHGTVLIPGGWMGTPTGHAIYYEVNKKLDGTYTFRVYNRGAGLSYHDDLVKKAPHKFLYPPVMEYENISEQNIFNALFIQGLVEFKAFPKMNGNEYDIYEGLLPLLKGDRKKLNLEMQDLMSEQHSGTCSWKSFCAFMRGKLSYNEYKLFMFRIKQQGLWDYYHANHEAISSNPTKKNLFEKAIEGFASSLDKIEKGGLISSEEYLESLNCLVELKENMVMRTLEHLQELHRNAPIVSCTPLKIQPNWNLSITQDNNTKKTSLQGAPPSAELTNFLKKWKPNAENLVNDFQLIHKNFTQAKIEGKYDDICSAFTLLMEKIPLPEVPPKTLFWKTLAALPHNETLSLMKALSDIHDSFFKSTFVIEDPQNHDPQFYVAMYKGLAIQDALINSAGAENLELKGFELPPDFFYLEYLLGNFPASEPINSRPFYFPLRDPRAKDELMAIHDYFLSRAPKGLSASDPLPFQTYHIYPDFSINEASAADSFNSQKLNPELAYIRELLKDTTFVSKVKKYIVKFDELRLIEKIGAVYTLDTTDVFPESFLLYRRQISQVYLFTKPDNTNPTLDLDKDLQLIYKQKTTKDFSDRWKTEISVSCAKSSANRFNYYNNAHFSVSQLNITDTDKVMEEILSQKSATTDVQNLFLNSGESLFKDLVYDIKLTSSLEEVIYLVTNPETQVTEILAYMIQHPEALKNKTKYLLEKILFEGNLLLKEIRYNPEFFGKFSEFLHKTYFSFLDQGEIDCCCFLLEITHNLQKYKDHLSENNPALSKHLNQSFPLLDPLVELTNLEKIKSLNDNDKSSIFSHFIAFCSDLEKKDEPLIKKIILGIAHLNKHPLPLTQRSPSIERGIRKTKQDLAGPISHLPQKKIDDILNSIIESETSIKGNYSWKLDSFPQYSYQDKDKLIKINILQGHLFFNDQTNIKLPLFIVEGKKYWEHFDREYRCRPLDIDTFEFTDISGHHNVIQSNNQDQFTLLKTIDGRQCKLVKKLASFPFTTELDFYISEKPTKIYACDRTGKEYYCIHYDDNNKPVRIENLLHTPSLDLVDIYSDRDPENTKPDTYTFLVNFESSSNIRVWEDNDKEPKRIELPRFNLTFISVTNPKNGKKHWECQEIKSFFLSKEQFIEPFAKLGITSFLKLENAKGEIKLLLPRHNLGKDSLAIATKRVFDPEKTIDGQESSEKTVQKYLVYNFDKHPGRSERELKMGPEESLYMAMLALSAGSDEGYRFARYLLDPNKLRTGQVRDEELELLNWICRLESKNHDHDPRAIALRLHSLYLLSEQMERNKYPLTKERSFWDGVMKDLSNYASTLQHSQGYHLPIHELNKLCQLAIKHTSLPPEVVHLLKTIGPDIMGEWIIPLTDAYLKPSFANERLARLKVFSSNFLIVMGRALKETQKKILLGKDLSSTTPMITRSQDGLEFFVRNLPIAFHGTPDQKQTLRDILILRRGDFKEMPMLFNTILEMIFAHPKQLKMLDSKFINWEEPGLLQHIIDIAIQEYGSNKRITITPQKMHSTMPTLRPKTLPESIKIPSKVPEVLFGDSLKINIEEVQAFDSSNYLEKIDEKTLLEDRAKKDRKLNIVHQDIKNLLAIPTNRIEKKVVERLEEGCTIYLNKQKGVGQEFKLQAGKLDQLENDLENHIAFRLSSQQKEAVRLCFLADAHRSSSDTPMVHALHKLVGMKERFTIDDLCLLYAKGALGSICGPDVEAHVRFYLEAATYTQQLDRSLQRVREVQKNLNTDDRESAEIALIAEMTKSRVIDPVKYPSCLVLEYYSNILMHQGQYDNMKIFLETGDDFQPIRHMIMGSGKTSVLMRLLGLLRADGEKLSILVFTDDLLEPMSEEVRSGSVGTFDQFLIPFEIGRNTDLSLDKLKELKDKLERCRLNQGVLTMSPKSIHCFYLNFLETCFKGHLSEGSAKVKILELIGVQREILGLFGKYGSALLDEADLLLNCRTEVNFPFGKEMSMPEEEQNLILDLYEVIINNPEITRELKCDFSLKTAEGEATLYIEKSFRERIKPVIVSAMLKKMNLIDFSPDEISIITTYLLQNGDTAQNKKAEFLVAGIKDSSLKNVLSLLKEELNTLLPMTLEKNCGEHYGYSLVDDLAFAIPANNGMPIEGSRFSNPHETGTYTVPTAIKFGVKQQSILNKLASLEKLAQEQTQKGVALRDTPALKEFLMIVGGSEDYHLLKLSSVDKKNIIKTINEDYDLQRYFLKTYVLPSISFNKRKLNSNGHMLSRFFGKVQGFSGTLWNADTFPNMLSPNPEHDVDAMSLFILSGHLIEIDGSNVTKINNVISIDNSSSDAILIALGEELKKGTNVLAIADSGGYLNECKPEDLANQTTELLHKIKPSIKGTAYFDQNSNLVIKEHGRSTIDSLSGSTVAKENRLTIYAQRFTTGTDIKQAPTAVALVTIGRKTLLRDLFQTIWRMREVDRGQRIKFLVDKDIEQVIRQKLKIGDEEIFSQDHILRFCLSNQIEQLSDDIVGAAKQKMLNIVQWEVLKVMLDPTVSNTEISSIFISEMKDLFCPKQATTAYELYGRSNEVLPIESIMQQEKNDCLSLLNQLLKKAPILDKRINLKEVEAQLNDLLKNELLPEKALSPTSDKDKRVQVQQKQRTQQQVQQQEITVFEEDNTKWQFQPWPAASADKIFDPAFYNAPSWGKGYTSAVNAANKSVSFITSAIPQSVSNTISPYVPTTNQSLGIAATYLTYQIQPALPIAIGIASAVAWASTKFSDKASIVLNQAMEDASRDVNTWVANKLSSLPSLEAMADGAPLPYKLSDFLKQDRSLKALEQALDPALTVTDNFAPRKAYKANMKVVKPLKKGNKKIHELLLMQNKSDLSWKVVIIDKEEAKYFRNQLIKDQKDGTAANHKLKICLYNPTIGVIQKGVEGISDEDIQKDKIVLKLIVQAKFFNGEGLYTEAERKVLKTWIDANNPAELKEIFRKKILANHPDSTEVWDRVKDLFPA